MAPPSVDDVAVHATSDGEAIVIPDPLTFDGVPGRRSKSAKFNGGIAAYTTSDFYKTPVSSAIIFCTGTTMRLNV
jgi:aromatic amino acid aminotransferase I